MENNMISVPFEGIQSLQMDARFDMVVNLYQAIRKTLNHSIRQSSAYCHSIPQTAAHVALMIAVWVMRELQNGFAPIMNISLGCVKVDELGPNHSKACQVPVVMLLIIYVAILFYRALYFFQDSS